MLTYNQIIKISRDFQQAHYVLKNFGAGSDFDQVLHNQQNTYKYPILWMEDLSDSLSEGSDVFSFRCSFAAPVVTLKDRGSDLMSSNLNEVKSDMIQCAKDFISYWVNQTDLYPLLTIEKNINLTKFEDVTPDKLAGCYIDITFRQPFNYDECAIPMGTPSSTVTCLPVYIYENGVLVDTVASGGSYSYTTSGGSFTYDLYFDGVDTGQDVTADGTNITINLT